MVYLPIFGRFLGQMLVKNPAPWSIWVNRTKENQFLTVCYGLIKERRVDSGLKKVGWK